MPLEEQAEALAACGEYREALALAALMGTKGDAPPATSTASLSGREGLGPSAATQPAAAGGVAAEGEGGEGGERNMDRWDEGKGRDIRLGFACRAKQQSNATISLCCWHMAFS